MTQQEIIENNKLITEFMEINTSISHDHQGIYLYHLSYDWLIPVIEKIGLHYGCIVEINYALVVTCRICYLGKTKYDKAINFYGHNNGEKEPIMAVYECVVEFLKYLNNVQINKK